MIKNSTIWRSIHAAWQLSSDCQLPVFLEPDQSNKSHIKQAYEEFNPLYFMPLWGALAGLAALIAGKIFAHLLPVNGSSILFAITFTALSEMRTTGRGLALNVTFFENLFGRKGFLFARTMRVASLKQASGLIALLIAVGMLGGKFFSIMLVARTGHYGVASAAMVIALGIEALLASENAAAGVPRFCRRAKGEYIVALCGFLLLFNLIFLPLATLIVCAVSTALTTVMTVIYLKRCNEINSDDMTMTGYLLEFAVWAVMALLIA